MSGDERLAAYGQAALDAERHAVAQAQRGGRNEALNRAAFSLGRLAASGAVLKTDAIAGLVAAAHENGLVDDDGLHAVNATISGGIASGMEHPRDIPDSIRDGRHNGHAHRTAMQRESPRREYVACDPAAAKSRPSEFPEWTEPDEKGRPKFHAWDASGPPKRDSEQRRHVYARGGIPVRIKIRNRDGDGPKFVDWYRVTNDRGEIGWQAKKPKVFQDVPYIGSIDPFDPELTGDVLAWPEGERDVDTLTRLLIPAITFGGKSNLPTGAEAFCAGRRVVIFADRDLDGGGLKHAEEKAALCLPVAASVKIIIFNEKDVSDFIDGGGTADDLHARIDAAPIWKPADPTPESAAVEGSPFRVTMFSQIETCPRKQWLRQGILGAGEFSVVFGAPGSGKSVLAGDLCCHVAADMPWLGRTGLTGCVLYIAAERKAVVERRFAAFGKKYEINDIPLALVSGTFDLISSTAHAEFVIAHAKALERSTNRPCVLIVIDTISRVLNGGDENSPKDMGALVASVGIIQEQTGAHVMALHHIPADGSQRLRGHGALLGACDTTIAVERLESQRTATVQKSSDGEEGQSIGFNLETIELSHNAETDETTTAPVVVACSGDTNAPTTRPKTKLTKGAQIALRAITAAISEKGEPATREKVPAGVMAAPLDLWRTYAYARGISGSNESRAKQMAFHRSAESLFAAGIVGTWEGSCWLVKGGEHF